MRQGPPTLEIELVKEYNSCRKARANRYKREHVRYQKSIEKELELRTKNLELRT
jgi:hypothetical protein